MFAQALSASLLGVEAFLVRVEAHHTPGSSSFRMVGLPTKTVREAERRVRAALRQCNRRLQAGIVTVNLAPADLPKDGAALDLAIAVALSLVCENPVPEASFRGWMFVGELALDGRLRPVRGTLAAADRARGEGLRGIVVPRACAAEARTVSGLEVLGVRSLPEAIGVLTGQQAPPPPLPAAPADQDAAPDLQEVRGQATARRALEIAAAGEHNLLMTGPPGSGKSMLAARLPGILPELDERSAVESTKVHSAAGTLPSGVGLLRTSPFRAPHHTVSYAGLLGGGTVPQPGEVSLAHNGVLFLDEIPEFRRHCLEGLRQPLEEGVARIVRRAGRFSFPARFVLVGARNPCKCGWHATGKSAQDCRCTPREVDRYLGRLSGPLLDRFDMRVEVPAVPVEELLRRGAGEPSSKVRERVLEARRRAAARFRELPFSTNARMDVTTLEEHVRLGREGEDLLQLYARKHGLSARAVHRVLRVARTLADLEGLDRVGENQVHEATQFRGAS